MIILHNLLVGLIFAWNGIHRCYIDVFRKKIKDGLKVISHLTRLCSILLFIGVSKRLEGRKKEKKKGAQEVPQCEMAHIA